MTLTTTLNAFAYTTGPRDASILIVGEAWGAEEARLRLPFQGLAGKELDKMLFDAGLNRAECLCTNVIDAQPRANDFTQFLRRKKDPSAISFKDTYVSQDLINGITKLRNLISLVKPKLIIACGNWPLWALSDHTECKTVKGFRIPSGIMKHRGSQTYTTEIHGQRYPLLPIIHPSTILRQYSLRTITCHDLRVRAKRFIRGELEWKEPARNFFASGSFVECQSTLRFWLNLLNQEPLQLAVDVETWKRKYLAVVGLSDGKNALAVPFFYFENDKLIQNFSLDEEVEIVSLLRRILRHPNLILTNQNYFYDFQFLFRWLWVDTRPQFDTMVAHHLIFPGTPKDLATLASLYCDHYTYWKDESQDWDAKSTHQEMWFYNCKDTMKTYEITEALKGLLQQMHLTELYAFRMEEWDLAASIWLRGFNWDNEKRNLFRRELVDIATKLQEWLLEAMPEDIRYAPSGKPWYSSNPHLQYILYTLLQIKPVLNKKTKKPTVDKESFETLKKRFPLFSNLFDNLKLLRSIDKYRTSYIDARPRSNGKMSTQLNIAGTETFRWSSSADGFGEGLNMQNLAKPARD